MSEEEMKQVDELADKLETGMYELKSPTGETIGTLFVEASAENCKDGKPHDWE